MADASHAAKGSAGPGGASRRLDIQGLRALAVLTVVAFHAGLPMPGGFVGVDVFFVISGFVITSMLTRELTRTGTIRFGRFYLRRFKRLTPALGLTVLVTACLAAVLGSPFGPQETAAKTGIGAMLLSANLVIATTTGGYFDAPAGINPLLNTWSLSVEEQFYLGFPLLLFLGWRLRRRASWAPVAAIALVAVTSFVLAVAGSFGTALIHPGLLVGFYSPLARAWEFAVGALLSLAPGQVVSGSPRRSTVVAAVGALMLGASLCLISERTTFPGLWTLVPVVATLFILAAGADAANPLARALSSAAMVKIGDWSYSLYLWHWPFIVFAKETWPGNHYAPLIAALLSALPALASYHWVEEPIRSLQGMTQPRVARLIGVVMIPPLAACVALIFVSQHGFWVPRVEQYRDAVVPLHAGKAANCTTNAWLSAERCTWNAAATGRPVYLVGDSNADHFSEAVIAAGGELGRPVALLTEDGCRFSETLDPAGGSLVDYCRVYTPGVLNYLESANDGLVIISNFDADPSLENLARRIQRAGHRILLIQAVPRWEGSVTWQPSACSLLVVANGGCDPSMSMDDVLTNQAPYRTVLAQVAQATGSAVMDPVPMLCPSNMCSVESDGLVRYRDATHISVQQSIQLTGAFTQAIREAESS